jgi:hypothetical protein
MRRSESFDEAKLDQRLVRLRCGLLAELRMDATLTMIDVAARALDEAASKPRRSARRRVRKGVDLRNMLWRGGAMDTHPS